MRRLSAFPAASARHAAHPMRPRLKRKRGRLGRLTGGPKGFQGLRVLKSGFRPRHALLCKERKAKLAVIKSCAVFYPLTQAAAPQVREVRPEAKYLESMQSEAC